jgi:signal transduction histidine kinase
VLSWRDPSRLRALTALSRPGGTIRLTIDDDDDDDDGVGGADASLGSGLIGLRDRVEALGGSFRFSSPQATAR